MHEELLYQVALTMIPDLGVMRVKSLLDRFEKASDVFKARKKEIASTEGIGEVCARSIREWKDFAAAEKEITLLEKNNIRPLFFKDEDYPQRLLHCYDPPVLLYYKGNADLNNSRIVSIIGTRSQTEYGRQLTEQLVKDLSGQHVLIISGLAFGIDSIAHKIALQEQIDTVGVLGHGLDLVYPWQNKTLVKEMLQHGGLLTEFRLGTQPDKHNFPKRNRIVAGMADATLVIETAIKGGSMITAELAFNYNRDLFAFPGRTTDNRSSGCLQLIKQNKAILLTDGIQLLETMGWAEKKKKSSKQKELFVELSDDEKKLVAVLRERGPIPIDAICYYCGLTSSVAAAAMLNLEMQDIIISMPGKMYQLA